jgi:uncharacterized protein (DUF2384 family)
VRLVCVVDGCERPAYRSTELCHAHRKRRQRGQALSPPVAERVTGFARVLEAAIAIVDCDSDDDGAFESAKSLLRKAAEAWVSERENARNGTRPCAHAESSEAETA